MEGAEEWATDEPAPDFDALPWPMQGRRRYYSTRSPRSQLRPENWPYPEAYLGRYVEEKFPQFPDDEP
jgi:hypothetical protein